MQSCCQNTHRIIIPSSIFPGLSAFSQMHDLIIGASIVTINLTRSFASFPFPLLSFSSFLFPFSPGNERSWARKNISRNGKHRLTRRNKEVPLHVTVARNSRWIFYSRARLMKNHRQKKDGMIKNQNFFFFLIVNNRRLDNRGISLYALLEKLY